MSKRKFKTLMISFSLAVAAVCLSLAFVACSGGGDDKKSGNYGVGEEGIYYYDATTSEEYLMTLQSGTYMISVSGASGYSGTYSYDKDAESVSFTGSDGSAFAAAFTDDAMQLAISGTPYTFLKKVDYTVMFMDGNASIGTQSVTYGRSAEKLTAEKDGYIFIGWYEDSAFTAKYGFNTAVTGDLTLYAYYIEEDATVANYDVAFVVDGETVYETKTQNGVVYDMYEDENVLGWWVSDTNKEDELTYKYDGQILDESVKLFAVKKGSLGASVYDDRVTWDASVSSVSVTVDGETILTGTGNALSYSFASLSTGRHEILVSAVGYGDETLVYVTNGLSRVSNFAVYGTTLVYNRVENAQYYYISVTCANPSHDHTMVYNGNTLTYDFSNCEMGPDGISFTVYAYASGYETSVSETYVYALILDGTTVKIDSATDTASWTAVSGATGYEVYVNDELVATTTDTEYSLKYYDIEDKIAVSVRPVAPGYYSEESEAVSYTKVTLPAPEITGINEYTVSWSEVVGATNYIIYVNGKQIETVSYGETEYALATDGDFVKADSYVITIKATNSGNANQNSQESDPVYATDDTMSPLLTYENGTVYWQYAMAVGTYYVSINDEDETEVYGKNSFDVAFTRSGENVIKVYFKTDKGDSAVASLTVTTYAVIFNSEGGELIDTMYVAKGDVLNLTEPEYKNADAEFAGWFTLPDLVGDYDAFEYLGDGYLVQSGSVFDGNSTLVLYAGWLSVKYVTYLDPGMGYVLDEEGQELGSTLVAKNSSTFSVPVPETSDAAYVFYGWYSEADGKGTRYTDEKGRAVAEYDLAAGSTLYAYWVNILTFTVSSHDGETYLSVSKGSDISKAPDGVVTVPDKYTIDGVEYTVGILESSSFNSCSSLVTLNLPDTIVYIPVSNSGYSSGSGAFALSRVLKEVNIYATGEPDTGKEVHYYSHDGVLYELESDGELQLIYYPYAKSSVTYTIPDSISNENEYTLDASLNEVPVERTVGSIATRVLSDNTHLTTIIISGTVNYVDQQAFYNNKYITSIVFEESSDASATLTIAANAFQKCTALETITLPSSLVNFDSSIFTDCTALEYIYIDESASGNYVSRNGMLCNAAGTEIIYAPLAITYVDLETMYGLTTIGESAFEGRTKITYIAIPSFVTEIGESAFEDCTALEEIEFLGDSQSQSLTIKTRAFYGCTALTVVTLPENLAVMEQYAFGGCRNLKTVYVNSVGDNLDFADNAFATSASSHTFYVETVYIGSDAGFFNISGVFGNDLASIYVVDGVNPDGSTYSNPNYLQIDGVVYSGDGTTMIYFPGDVDTFDTTSNTSLTTLESQLFNGKTNLKYVIIGISVTDIGEQAFYNCTSLESLTFEAGTRASELKIGKNAFAGCTSLASIFIPAETSSIGDYAFDGCSALTAVTFEAVDSASAAGELSIGSYAFRNTAVKSIVMPSGVTEISDYTFYGCSELSSVTFPEEMTSIGARAFYGCSSLTEVKLSSALESLGDYAFYNCTSLKSVDFGSSLKTIGVRAFYGCSELESVVILDSVTSVGEYAFYDCEALTSVTFNGSLGTISDYTFYGCSSLASITLPAGLTTIGDYAFYGCSSLTALTIPSSVTKIGKYASNGSLTNLYNVFLECTSLTSITVEDGNTYFSSVNGMLFDAAQKILYVVPEAMTSVDFTGVTIEEIRGYAFYNCAAVTAIEIPTSVVIIELNAFKNCENLTSIKILEGEGGELVLEEGTSENGVFGSLPALTEMVLSDRVKTIPAYTFDGCTSLESIEIPCGVTSMGLNIFDNCTSLKTVTFKAGEGDTLTMATGSKATVGVFASLASLETVTLTNRITSIPAYCFNACTSLKEIEILDSVTTIEKNAFQTCTSLEKVTFNEGLVTLGDYSFDACSALYSVETPSTVTSMGKYAFRNCTKLTNLTLNDGLTEIGTYAFYSTHIYELVIPDSVTSIGTYMCQNCYELSCVTIGSGLSSLANYSFSNCYKLVEIHNRSESITITIGETGTSKNGAIGGYAQIIYGPDDTPVSGFETTTDGYRFFYNTDEDGVMYYLLLNYLGTGGDIVLPAGINGYSYSVYNRAFYQNDTITSVVISEGVTSLDTYAFRECTSLKTVTIGNTVTSIGQYAFSQCPIEEIVIPSSVTEIMNYCFVKCASLKKVTFECEIDTIGREVFEDCSSLTEIEIPACVTSIGMKAFSGSGLTKVTMNEGLVEIGEQAFSGTGLLSVTIPNSVTTIGADAFKDCASLMSVVIGSGAKDITKSAFSGDYKLVEVYNLSSLSVEVGVGADESGNVGQYALAVYTSLDVPTGINYESDGLVTFAVDGEFYVIGYIGEETDVVMPDKIRGNEYDIADYAFYGTDITSIVFSDNTTEIGAYAFSEVTTLKSVTLPANLVTIGGYAFYGCTGLNEITIPSTLTFVGTYGFMGCTYLKRTYVDSLETWFGIDFESGSSNPLYNEGGLYVNGEVVTGDIVVPDTVTEIYPYVFYKAASLTSLIIPDSVTTIGTYAFFGTDLKEVTIGKNVTYIGSYAFAECRSITEIVIPDSVEETGVYAFRYCEALEKVTIGTGLKTLGNYTFQNCYALSEVYFNATSVDDKSSNNSVFYGCGTKSATDGYIVYIGDNVERIPAYLFSPYNSASTGKHNLTAVIFGENSVCTSIGQYAFRYCSMLEYIVIPASLESIAANAFRDCGALEIVYYGGTEEQWRLIDIDDSYNTAITEDAVFYYFSSTMPAYNAEGTACDSGYWHYDENNLPVEWVYEPTRYYVESSVNFVMYNEDLGRIVALYLYDSRIRNTVGYLVTDFEYSEEEGAYIVELENGDMYLIELDDETLTSTITEYFPDLVDDE